MNDELDCYHGDCRGTLEYRGDNPDDPALYRCRDCGDEFIQEDIEHWAEQDGAVSKLAKVLLEGYHDS